VLLECFGKKGTAYPVFENLKETLQTLQVICWVLKISMPLLGSFDSEWGTCRVLVGMVMDLRIP